MPKEHKGVGIQLRSFPTITEDFLNSLADNVLENFKDDEIKLLSLQDSLDLEVLENFSRKLEKRGINSRIYRNDSILETVETISNLEYLIGMRFHANLVAVKSGVKVLGINYDVKVENLANSVSFPLIEIENQVNSENFKKVIKTDTASYKIPDFDFIPL